MLRKIIFGQLRTKLMIAFFVVMLIPMAEIGLYGYSFTSSVLTKQAVDRTLHEVYLQAEHIVTSLTQAQGDALYLSEMRSFTTLRRLLKTSSNETDIARWHDEVVQDFMVLLSVRPMYQNLRYLNDQGMELLRIESNGQRVVEVDMRRLRNHRETNFYASAIELEEDGVYVSPFESHEDSNAPVVHYAMKVNGGVIVIDIHVGWILRNLPRNDRTGTWAMIDQSGKYLVHPTPEASSISAELSQLLSPGAGSLDTSKSVVVYDTIFPSAGRRDQFWVLYRDTPSAIIYADLTNFYATTASFFVAALVMAVGLAMIVSHNVVSPIIDLERQAAQFGRGGPAPQAPSHLPADEIGSLSRTFYQMAHELERKRREAKTLIERLITAQEEERKIIAYDLHDGLIQQLVGARLYLTTHGNSNMPADLKHGCDALSEAIVEGRRIIEGLRPATLDDLGLTAAISELAHSVSSAAGWDLQLDVHALPEEPEKTIGVTIYRIAQEALSNARKHSSAHTVQVHLYNGHGISLTIHDDGKGFEPDAVSREERGFGITTMRERAELLNGTCIIDSEPGEGTTIAAWIPWQPEKEEQEEEDHVGV